MEKIEPPVISISGDIKTYAGSLDICSLKINELITKLEELEKREAKDREAIRCLAGGIDGIIEGLGDKTITITEDKINNILN